MNDIDSPDYNDTNIGPSHVYDTPEEKEIRRLISKLSERHKIAVRYETLYKETRDELDTALQQVAELTRERDLHRSGRNILTNELERMTNSYHTVHGDLKEVAEHRDRLQADLAAALAHAEAGEGDTALINDFIEALGSFHDDSATAVQIYPDDATRTWHVSIGRDEGYSSGIRGALRAAIDAAAGGTKETLRAKAARLGFKEHGNKPLP